MVTPDIIIIPVSEELSEHLFNVVQGFLLGLGGLLLSFHSSAEIIIAVIGHMHRYFARFIELSVTEEAYPLTSPSSSDHWKIPSDGSG